MATFTLARAAKVAPHRTVRHSTAAHSCRRERSGAAGAPTGFPRFLSAYSRTPSVRGALHHNVSFGRAIDGRELRDTEASTSIDLSGAQLHDDVRAQAEAVGMGAHAFTFGNHIYLGPTVDSAYGPRREEALRHELVHVAQIRRGELTGDRASEAALEGEAVEHTRTTAAPPVRHGADPGMPHGLFDLFEDEEESSSSSGYDSSRLGMQRTIWDHLWEAVEGVWEVGSYDAYAAGFGEDAEAAGAFGAQFDDRWMENAARHGVWQARLAFKHGEASAAGIGNAHEEGSPDALDSWIDQYNNRIGREIGANASSLEAIPDLIQVALDDGRLITDPNDARIPEALRQSAP